MIPNLNAVRDAVAFRMDWLADQGDLSDYATEDEIRELNEALDYLDDLAKTERG